MKNFRVYFVLVIAAMIVFGYNAHVQATQNLHLTGSVATPQSQKFKISETKQSEFVQVYAKQGLQPNLFDVKLIITPDDSLIDIDKGLLTNLRDRYIVDMQVQIDATLQDIDNFLNGNMNDGVTSVTQSSGMTPDSYDSNDDNSTAQQDKNGKGSLDDQGKDDDDLDNQNSNNENNEDEIKSETQNKNEFWHKPRLDYQKFASYLENLKKFDELLAPVYNSFDDALMLELLVKENFTELNSKLTNKLTKELVGSGIKSIKIESIRFE
jgi:hypothetical protein